ncbi:hypothetical protein IQ63_31790 [Streptomyces acidiscabies]|uniref:Uncharacterized protein n=2 Tax=Streptomyces acidiscabies TaxID=42234 RepID=A0A0L0JUI4_9ACTN|nr:hypothetical protein IQ63_31790 [Streptomyces acidiscabies]
MLTMKPPTKKLRAALVTAAAAGLALVTASGASATPSYASYTTPSFGSAHRVTTAADGQKFDLRLGAFNTSLPAAGGTVDVAGYGYNRAQGIFLAFCVVPKGVVVGHPETYTTLPTPCLGGRESTDGSARRITDTGTGTPGVTLPYQEGGSFLTALNLKAEIADGVTCGVNGVQCAIVTRADFTATADRSYDQYIPVNFN